MSFGRVVIMAIALLGLTGCAGGPARRRAGSSEAQELRVRPVEVTGAPTLSSQAMTGSDQLLYRTNDATAGASKGPLSSGWLEKRHSGQEAARRSELSGGVEAGARLPGPLEGFPETWVPVNRWARSRGLEAPVKTGNGAAPSFALNTPRGTLVFRAGSQVATWDGLQVHLGFAPQLIDGQPYLHNLDVSKTLFALAFSQEDIPVGRGLVVVIDPGHGGADAGTGGVSGRRNEKDLTLDLAKRLQSLLIANGWQVWLTRSNDTEMALSSRVAFAENRKANLFLSLHFNSAGMDQSERGLETYCLTPSGLGSTLTRGFSDDSTLKFPNNSFDSENLQLAMRIHRELLQVNGHFDRGVRRARFPAVLRGQNCPAVLIEGGYLSNPSEEKLIGSAEYRQRFAEAIARALSNRS